jgi:hypothetical protein
MISEDDFSVQMKTLEEQLAAVERSCAPPALDGVRALVRAVLDVHQSGLREILEVVSAATLSDGTPVLRALCERASIASLLLMHELHPDDFDARIERAVREANESATGQLHAFVVAIEGQRVQLRIEGGPPGAALVLRRVLERVTCEHAPEAIVQIEGGESTAHASSSSARDELIPVSRLYARATERGS